MIYFTADAGGGCRACTLLPDSVKLTNLPSRSESPPRHDKQWERYWPTSWYARAGVSLSKVLFVDQMARAHLSWSPVLKHR